MKAIICAQWGGPETLQLLDVALPEPHWHQRNFGLGRKRHTQAAHITAIQFDGCATCAHGYGGA